MGIRKFLTYLLDKKRYSSYPEILGESALVLWFVCQICLKFGQRVLPEWRTIRLDPDRKNSFDSLLELSGLHVDACFWDDAMSGWTKPQPYTVARLISNSSVWVLPPASTRILGYVVTLVCIMLAAILAVSLVFLMAVNRHWTRPVSTDQLPYCRKLAVQLKKRIRCAANIHLPDSMVILLHTVIGIASFIVYYHSWMIVNALMVLLAWLSVILAINVFGPSTVFPACVVFVAILTVYCTGRIWGLWMNDTYAALIKKEIRKLTAAKSTDKPLPIDALLEKKFTNSSRKPGRGRWESAACCMIAFCMGCIVVYYNVWPISLRQSMVKQHRE